MFHDRINCIQKRPNNRPPFFSVRELSFLCFRKLYFLFGVFVYLSLFIVWENYRRLIINHQVFFNVIGKSCFILYPIRETQSILTTP